MAIKRVLRAGGEAGGAAGPGGPAARRDEGRLHGGGEEGAPDDLRVSGAARLSFESTLLRREDFAAPFPRPDRLARATRGDRAATCRVRL